MSDPSSKPPRTIRITLGQTVRDFMLANNLSAENGRTNKPDKDNYDIALDVVADVDPIIFGDHWIHLFLKNEHMETDLLTGRTLFISQEAGRIKSFCFTPFSQPNPLDETNRLAKKFIDDRLKGNWTPKARNSISFALSDHNEDLTGSGEKICAQLKDSKRNLLNVTVVNLAKVPTNASYILIPDHPRPKHDPPVYLIRLCFYWAHRNDLSYGDLVFPRRIFVHGNQGRHLILRPWVDDPEWTPQKAGMIDLGGTGEQRKWKMPKK